MPPNVRTVLLQWKQQKKKNVDQLTLACIIVNVPFVDLDRNKGD
jgi:hypothetical protein